MFVKIIYWKVRKEKTEVTQRDLKAQHMYEVSHYSLFPTKTETEEAPAAEMNLCLEFNKNGPDGWDRTISFPCGSENEIVEICIMNDHGKTIDRRVY